MPSFTYTARDTSDTRVNGVLQASSENAAVADLRGRGWLVLGIEEEVPQRSGVWNLKPSEWLWIRSLDIEVSLYQLSTLLRSGLTLLSALRLIAEQAERGRLRRVWEQVIIDIEGGESLADAMMNHSCFQHIVTQLVNVGEQTGHLAPVLERAAAALEKKRVLRAGLLTTLMYPAIVFLVALGLAVFMIVSVLPKMQVFLKALGKRLPPMTQNLVDLGEWMQAHGLSALIALVVALFALVAVFFWPPGRAVIDRVALRLPLLGKAFRTSGTALFANSFSALLGSGVTIIEGLRVTERLIGNHRLSSIIGAARERVMQGDSLGRQLDRPHGFMPMLPRMVTVGESAGTLDVVLDEVARYHEAQLERLVRRISALIEPAVIIIVGSVVGYVYLSFFMALFAATGPGNNIR
ncbi:MAG: type II secretion system F family protein [Prosthecobacter sp.]